ALRRVDDADEAVAGRGDNLLARERAASALDHPQRAVDFVGAVDVDRDAVAGGDHLIEVEHDDADRAQALGAALGARYRARDAIAPSMQRFDEHLDRRAASDADDRAVDEFVERRPCRGALQFVLVHDGWKMGWAMGFEPTTTGITIRDSTPELRPPSGWPARQESNL